jgi:asparagine synthase (glutamine-hydrolysing)
VDSSGVVAAMAQQSAAPVKTFSIGFDVGSFDETRYAREVAELFSTEHEEFRVDPHAMDVLPQLVWHYGEPFADPSAIPSLYLAELTRRHVTVALNGDGGDENFAGYIRYFDNSFANRLRFTPKPTAAAAARMMDRVAGPHHRIRTLRRLRWLAHALAVDGAERYTRYIAAFGEDERDALYTADFLAELKSSPRSAPHAIGDAYRSSDAPSFLERLMDVDVQTYLPDDLLVKMDIATMAHSLEVRSPLLDHEFMEMAAALPASSKLQGRTSKRVLKDALRPWIPGHILDRPKMGFSVPLRDWFRGPLRALPAEVLLDPPALQRGMFREAGIRRLIDDHVDGGRDNSLKIWALLQLELWLQSYVDGEVPAPLTVGGL